MGTRSFVVPAMVALALLFPLAAYCQQPGGTTSYIIGTIAGNGYSGDNGPATSAWLAYPSGLAFDSLGNLYIAESSSGVGNHRIRKITPQGIITTVAGNGTRGFSGDGGPATAAQLNSPRGLAADKLGNLYIADSGNLRVRRVSPAGLIYTVAGGGSSYNGCVAYPCLATAVQLESPIAVAVAANDDLLIADPRKNSLLAAPAKILRVSSGGQVNKVSVPGLSDAEALAVDRAGNLYIADGSRVWKVSPDGKTSGVNTSSFASGIAVDATGNLFIADRSRIRRVSPEGTISTIAGTGEYSAVTGDGGIATSASVGCPRAIALHSSDALYIADPCGGRVRILIPVRLTPGCSYAVDPESRNFDLNGGNGTLALMASRSDCNWSALSLADWVILSSPATGSGNAIATYSVLPNGRSAPREGYLSVGARPFKIRQAGMTCSWSLNSNRVVAPSEGLSGSTIAVTANAPDCAWSAKSNAGWVFLTGGTSGLGSGAVTYTVGPNPGAARVGTVTVAGQTFSVQQSAAGVVALLKATGVVNAANFQPVIAPGSFVTIYGENLASAELSWDSAIRGGKWLPTTLGGVRVLVNGRECFVYFVSPTQVNVLTPPDTVAGPVPVEVQTFNGTTTTVSMARFSPAFFAYSAAGRLYPAALFANERMYVAAPGILPGAASRPAKPGDSIVLYANGLGTTNPPYPPGEGLTMAYPISDLSLVRVTVRGVPAAVQYAGMVYAGLFQVNIQVPGGIGEGDLPVVLYIGGQSTQPDAVLPFRR
jgi:uncharacterized protein (TIGR03437 family)